MSKGYPLFFAFFAQVAAILLLIPVMTWASPPEMPSLEQLTAKMQETYDKTQDLKATFVQELTIQTIKKTEREEGTVYFKNPKRMHWEYTRPTSKKLVVNPQKAWLYVPEDHAVYVQDAKALYQSRVILRFLSGMGRLLEDFQVEYAAPEATDQEGHYLLVLTPRQSDMAIDRLHLTIDHKRFQILQCSFSDAFGNFTRIRFQNIRTNSQLPESLFHFTPPKGVDIFNISQ
jgi:outer membrane lipoprotein carrier protein